MLLLSFEGIDGSGKTTQVRLLYEYLSRRATDSPQAPADPLLVREPGGTNLSERIRTLLLDSDLDIEPMAELLLFSAARAQLSLREIQPALDQGRIVLCDRFFDSSTAYQGAGRDVSSTYTDMEWLRDLHRRVTGGLTPDRTYLVEVDAETALRRRSQNGASLDRMETAPGDFYARVAAAYRTLAEREPERFLCLDGTASIDAIQSQIRQDVDALLRARGEEPPSNA